MGPIKLAGNDSFEFERWLANLSSVQKLAPGSLASIIELVRLADYLNDDPGRSSESGHSLHHTETSIRDRNDHEPKP